MVLVHYCFSVGLLRWNHRPSSALLVNMLMCSKSRGKKMCSIKKWQKEEAFLFSNLILKNWLETTYSYEEAENKILWPFLRITFNQGGGGGRGRRGVNTDDTLLEKYREGGGQIDFLPAFYGKWRTYFSFKKSNKIKILWFHVFSFNWGFFDTCSWIYPAHSSCIFIYLKKVFHRFRQNSWIASDNWSSLILIDLT